MFFTPFTSYKRSRVFTPTAQPFPGRQSSVRTVSNGVVYARTRGDEGGQGNGCRGHQLALEQHVSVMLPSLIRLHTSH